ncbi:hypothetical protein Tco_1157627 [Tanacetum coccineum]
MCKPAKETWQSLLITHQGNSQVKDNKINLFVQQYEQFTILEEESIDIVFAIFNTIIYILKALDEGFSSKNYVRKFLRVLHPKWRAKVKTIEESKDLSSLALEEFIGNLKVHEVIMEKDSKIYKGKRERVKSIALKAKKEFSDVETSTSISDDKEYAMAVIDFKKFFKRKGRFVRQPREEKKTFQKRDDKKGKSDRKFFRCGDPNHLIGECQKPPRNKEQKADNASSLDDDAMQIDYNNLCEISLKIINNFFLKTKRELLEKEIFELNEKIKKLERNKDIDIGCESCQQLRLENDKHKESQVKFVKFDQSANSLNEMLNTQRSPSSKGGLGFDKNEATTSGTKQVKFVKPIGVLAGNRSTIKADGSTICGFVDLSTIRNVAEHGFRQPMSS